jgi:hypothetical protein
MCRWGWEVSGEVASAFRWTLGPHSELKAGASSRPLLPSNAYSSHFRHLPDTNRTAIPQRRKTESQRGKVTGPRSHSQCGTRFAHHHLPGLATRSSVHTPLPRGRRNPAPQVSPGSSSQAAGLRHFPAGSSAPRATRAPARPARAGCERSLCGPGSPQESGRWGQSALRTPMGTQAARGHMRGARAPHSHRVRRLQNFRPQRTANPTLAGGGARTPGRRGLSTSAPGAPARPSRVSPGRPQPGVPTNSGAAWPPPLKHRARASPQPAAWPAGTHLEEAETEAQRGPDTSPRSHSAAARSRASPPVPGPPRYSQPVLPSSSRTSSEAEWAAPMVRAAGPAVGSQALGDRDRSEPRVPRGARARPLIAAAGGARS